MLSRWRAPGVIGSCWLLLLAVTVLYLLPTVTSGRLLLLALTLPLAIVLLDVG